MDGDVNWRKYATNGAVEARPRRVGEQLSAAASGLPGLGQVRAPEEPIEIGRRRSTRRPAARCGVGEATGRQPARGVIKGTTTPRWAGPRRGRRATLHFGSIRHSAWPGQITGRRRARSKMGERSGGQPVEKPVDGQ
jgi:hypothetical protein